MDSRSLQSLALRVGEALTLDDVFPRIVQGLAAQNDVALARVWVVLPGDICESCDMRPECPDQARCLHLVASAGNPIGSVEDWSYLNGHFRRIPLGVRKVGQIAASGEGMLIASDLEESHMVARADWARREGIVSFAGQPLISGDNTLGVLAVFSRAEITPSDFDWLRIFADHAAIAIGNARAFEDLRRAEAVMRNHAQLLDLSHDTVFVRDLSDAITYWNRGAEELYGWSRDEAVGKISHRLTHTIFTTPLEHLREELLRTGRWEGELVHTKRDGTQVVVASRWLLQRDEQGRPAAILETNNDVTDRHRLHNQLRRSQAYLVAAQEVGHTGSWARRISTGEIYWSEEVFRIFGLDSKTTAPSRDLLTELWHSDDREFAEQTIDGAVRDKTTYEMDVRIVRPDRSVRYVHVRGQPVFDATGETDEFIGVLMDITNRKRAERALRRARERALKSRFTAVLDERTRLARDIHDTLIQGFTGIALKLVAAINRVTEPESVVALQDLVGMAQQTLTDARRAVWDLRAPSPSAGEFPATVRTAAEECVRGTGLELEYDVGGYVRPVDREVEAVLLRVVQESITNVVKHADARTVRVGLFFGERRVRLTVSDDGRGFTVATDFQSYGGHWGLLGMRERASQVRGKLALRSTLGRGTTLVLQVPYVLRHELAPAHP